MEFMFSLPTSVQFGRGSSREIGTILRNRKCKRVFLIYDKGVKNAGLTEPILESLKKRRITVEEYDGVLPNPPDYQVEEAAQKARAFKADAIVALGGGSSMDTAKAVNILLTNPSPIHAYDGIDKVAKPGKFLIAIPTTAGTGSEVTVVSVVTDTEHVRKMVIFGKNVAPHMAIVDPDLIAGLPAPITASTGMDALTHGLESYVSLWATPLSDGIALESTKLIYNSLFTAYNDGANMEARSNVLLGSCLVGYAFSIANLGIVHSMAHPMSAHCNVPHGVANAVGLPYGMEYNVPAISRKKMRNIARVLNISPKEKSHISIGDEVCNALENLARNLRIPRLQQLGVPESLFPTIAHDAVHQELSTLSTPRKPTEEDIITLLKKAW